MGNLSPGMSSGVILQAVMPTSYSQGVAEITGGGAGWNSHICFVEHDHISQFRM